MRSELKNFAGGITDYIFTSDATSFEVLDNISITKDTNLETRWGSDPMDPADTKPLVSAPIPCAITEYQGYKIIFHGGQILAWNGSAWTEVEGKGLPNACLTDAGINPVISYFEWNKQLFITDNAGSKTVKMFLDNSNNFQLVTAGLPRIASLPTITPSAADGKNYIYSFHYYYEYMVKDVMHIDYGPVIEMECNNAADFSGSSNSITGLPVLVNTTKTHYDLANIKIKIYRTVDGGAEGYLVGTITNGTTSFVDTTTDANAELNDLLYISSGASDNDHPPVAKYLDLSNNCGWYANLVGYPYRVMQSQLNDPDSVPSSYILDFEEEIVGISSYQSNPIVFTENQIWRIEGIVEIDGNGTQRRVMVADGVGALSHASIVKTDTGVYFAGSTDSFYWTDGYNIKKVPGDNKNFPERYKEFSGNSSFIKAAFDKINQRIYWTVKTSAPQYFLYVYDINFNAFTTWSGRTDDFRPSAILCSKDKKIYRADESGYVFAHESTLYEDPIIVLGDPPSTWQRYPVIYTIKHIAFDFGVSDINKWVTKVTLAGEGKTNLDVDILSYDDSTTAPTTLQPINHRSGLVWEDPVWVYGSSTDIWAYEIRLSQTRFFKHGKLRCKRKQLYITNAETTIAQSYSTMPDSMGTVDATAKTLTVIDSSLIYLPSSAIGMDMVINGVRYEILEYSTDTFLLSDPLNTLVNGDTHWSILGYPHNQRFHLSSFIYTYENLDDKGGYYQRGVTINAS